MDPVSAVWPISLIAAFAGLAIALSIIAFAAAFHFYWAIGGKIGWSVSLPQREGGSPVMSSMIGWWRFGALGVAVFLVALALMLLAEVGAIRFIPFASLRHGVLILFAAACIARVIVPSRYVGFFKRLTTTRWAHFDTRYYSPMFLTLGLAILIVIYVNGFTVF